MATNDETIPIKDALKEIRDGVYLKSDSWSNEEVAKVVELYYKKGYDWAAEARAEGYKEGQNAERQRCIRTLSEKAFTESIKKRFEGTGKLIQDEWIEEEAQGGDIEDIDIENIDQEINKAIDITVETVIAKLSEKVD
jgi:transposase